jgi:hypothetical protein
MRFRLVPAAVAALATVLAPVAAADAGGPIDLVVLVAGAPAGIAPGPEVAAGQDVVITYQVTNTTIGWMYSTYLYQEGVGRVGCPERHLAPGTTVVCEVTVTALSGEFGRGAFVIAWPEVGAEVEDVETVFYTGVPPTPSNLANLALGGTVSQSGTGGTPPELAVDGNRDGDLAAGSVAMTYRVSDAWWEVDLGEVRDIDHVVLWNRTDCCAERLQGFHVFVSDEPFAVRDIKGTVDQPGVFDWYSPGEAGRRSEIPIRRTGRFVRIQLDGVDAVLQLAEVEVMGRLGDPVTPPPPVVTITLEAAIEGDAADAGPGPLLAPGATGRFTYTVTNTGSVDVYALYVWHEGLGRIECPQRHLAPGATTECARDEAMQPGIHVDVVAAQAWSDDGAEASANDPVYYTVGADSAAAGPALTLEAAVAGDDADEAPGPELVFGGALEHTYRITNVGTEELWALYVEHPGMPPVACPERHLLPGDTVECTAEGRAAAGIVVADVVASAWSGQGTRASAVDRVAYHTAMDPASRGVSLQATVNGMSAATAPGPVVAAGTTVVLAFAVSNTGVSDLYGAWIGAGRFGTASCPDRHLSPGETVVCSVTLPAQPGSYGARVQTMAYDEAGSEVEATTQIYFFVPDGNGASVKLEFLVDGLNGDVPAGPRIRQGEVMTFTYLVSNTGAVAVTGVVASDDRVGTVGCPAATIAPGATLVCTRRLTAQSTETSILAKVATAQGVSDTERLFYHVRPYGREDELILEVTINGIDADASPGPALLVGNTATIRYILTNNANQAAMWDAQILDPKVPASAIRCSGGPSLGAYQSMVCTATITIVAGQWSNQVVGLAWSSNGPRLDASDRVNYYGMP